MQFFNLKALLDATLTILTTTEAIAVDVWESIPVGARNLQAAFPSWKRVLPTESSEEPQETALKTYWDDCCGGRWNFSSVTVTTDIPSNGSEGFTRGSRVRSPADKRWVDCSSYRPVYAECSSFGWNKRRRGKVIEPMISVLADFYRYEYRQEFEAGNNEPEREIDEGMGN
jgi:hypothetical protein